MLSIFFLLHFLADFSFQTLKMGREKSEKFTVLLQHIGIHFLVFFLGTIGILGPGTAFLFSLLNATIHGIIDWYVWRFYKYSVLKRHPKIAPDELKRTFKFWEDPLFIQIIGFDQLLHSLTLVGLWQFFTSYLV